jgi:hypothetical protein
MKMLSFLMLVIFIASSFGKTTTEHDVPLCWQYAENYNNFDQRKKFENMGALEDCARREQEIDELLTDSDFSSDAKYNLQAIKRRLPRHSLREALARKIEQQTAEENAVQQTVSAYAASANKTEEIDTHESNPKCSECEQADYAHLEPCWRLVKRMCNYSSPDDVTLVNEFEDCKARHEDIKELLKDEDVIERERIVLMFLNHLINKINGTYTLEAALTRLETRKQEAAQLAAQKKRIASAIKQRRHSRRSSQRARKPAATTGNSTSSTATKETAKAPSVGLPAAIEATLVCPAEIVE